MNISVPGFSSKKKEPAEKVVQKLSAQGRNEREIINYMRKEGYPNEEISKALNKAVKFRVTGAPQPQPSYAQQSTMKPQPPQQEQGNFMAPPPDQPMNEDVLEMTEEEEIGLEELVEEIVEEKWRDSMEELKDVERAIVKLQDQVRFINQRIKHIGKESEEKKSELKDMIQDSSSHIENIESRVGSVEKAFKEFLPSLTQNVRSLSGIVEKMKEERKSTR